MRLENESRVAIIGGGPAGCFAAIQLLNRARESGLRLDVRIFDPRFDPDVKGVAACKGCAGIVSANAVQSIESLGLSVPPRVIQETIEEYRVHILGQTIRLPQPHPGRKILSVYRGRGPRMHQGEPIESFDSYLISEEGRHVGRPLHIAAPTGADTIPAVKLPIGADNRAGLAGGLGSELL